MSSADRTGPIVFVSTARWLRTQSYRHVSALVAVCAAVAAQRGLEVEIGFPHSFLLFYPTILIVALLAGFLPGVTATLLCAFAASCVYATPVNSFIVGDETDRVGLTLFVLVGAGISSLANSLRGRANRLQEFEKVVEGLEEMIVVVDRNYRYLIANRAFLNYRGMNREDLIGRRIAEILHPGVFEATIKDKLDESFRGKVVRYEMRYRYPNRGERDLVISYFPIEGPDGIDRVACVLRDVTEQKQAEAGLRESEDRYRDLVEHSEDLVCTHDLSGKLLSANPVSARVLGYEVDELLSTPMRNLIAQNFARSSTSISKGSVRTGRIVGCYASWPKMADTISGNTATRCAPKECRTLWCGAWHTMLRSASKLKRHSAKVSSDCGCSLSMPRLARLSSIVRCATFKPVAGGARTTGWETAKSPVFLTMNYFRKSRNAGRKRTADAWPEKYCGRSATALNVPMEPCNGFNGNCIRGTRRGRLVESLSSRRR